jgi:hypothetical protein
MHDDRQSGLGHRIDVAQNGARRDFQFGGQLPGGLAPPVLQEQEDLQQAGGAHRVSET